MAATCVNTVTHKKRLTPPVEAKITGDIEARLIALAFTTPPDRHVRWSQRLLQKPVLLTEGIPPLDHGNSHEILGLCEKHPLGAALEAPHTAKAGSTDVFEHSVQPPKTPAARSSIVENTLGES